jgi:hypothetical protein
VSFFPAQSKVFVLRVTVEFFLVHLIKIIAKTKRYLISFAAGPDRLSAKVADTVRLFHLAFTQVVFTGEIRYF